MNVSIIIPNFNKRTVFLQPWSYAYNLAKKLAFLGCNVTLFTNHQPYTFSTPDSAGELSLEVLPISSLRFLNRKSLEIIKQEKPDVVYWFGNSLSGMYIRRMRCLQVPIVLHISAVHYSFTDLQSLSFREMFLHWLHIVTSIPPGSFLVRLLNDDVITTITVQSKASKNRLLDFGVSREKIKVAPLVFAAKDLALDSSKSTLDAREDVGLEKENFIATYLGSPDTIRGTDTLIRAAFLLKSKIRNLNVIILSRRDSEKNRNEEILLQLVRKYDLADVVKIIPGILSREDVRSYLMASNVIVLPFKITLSEPPLTILEAMAMGKPVITTKTCGLPEIIDLDRGLLVRPEDARNLAKALYYLARSPQTVAKLGQRAKDFVLDLPSWNELGKWTKEVLYQATRELK